MARPKKFDYDSDDFYDEILALSMQGLTDAEIADSLDLSPEAFCCMKNGNYEAWSDEENERRSARLFKVLTRGRRKILGIVRGRYLKTALGGLKVKSITKRYVQDRCPCGGNDKECPECGGTGWIVITDKAIMQENETELPPNMQALSTWLYHHDEEWRKVEKKQEDEEDVVPHNTTKGVDIDAWIRKEVETDN